MIEGCKHGPKDFIPQPCVDCAREAAEEQERLAPLRRRARDLAAQVEQQEAVEHSSDPQPPSVSGLTRYINTTQLTATTWEIRIVEPDEPRREDDLVSLDEVDDAVARLTAGEITCDDCGLSWRGTQHMNWSHCPSCIATKEGSRIQELQLDVTRLREERDALKTDYDRAVNAFENAARACQVADSSNIAITEVPARITELRAEVASLRATLAATEEKQ